MLAPPATEKNREFLAIQQLLAAHDLTVPGVLGVNLEQGWLLLEDLGDRLLLPQLNPDSADAWYGRALQILQSFTEITSPALPLYSDTVLAEELSRFPQWFLTELLELESTAAQQHIVDRCNAQLIASAQEQPRVFVHRDFHSRNLMLVRDEALAIIDFQDAVYGPVTYDLVSLLRDCYIVWPTNRVQGWLLQHFEALQSAGQLQGISAETFCRWFDLMGLQRHLKVLGTFARLALRDGKTDYLADLPVVLAYVRQVLAVRSADSPALAAFSDWFEQRVVPPCRLRGWIA